MCYSDGRARAGRPPRRPGAGAGDARRRGCRTGNTAADQAAAAGHSLGHELVLLTIHGVLHLLGYDHAEAGRRKRDVRSAAGACSKSGSPTKS